MSMAETGEDIVIRVRGLVNKFGQQVVHDGVDLDVRRGEVMGVVVSAFEFGGVEQRPLA